MSQEADLSASTVSYPSGDEIARLTSKKRGEEEEEEEEGTFLERRIHKVLLRRRPRCVFSSIALVCSDRGRIPAPGELLPTDGELRSLPRRPPLPLEARCGPAGQRCERARRL
jgi:hypothetical protein